jgi:hypothetical protein
MKPLSLQRWMPRETLSRLAHTTGLVHSLIFVMLALGGALFAAASVAAHG